MIEKAKFLPAIFQIAGKGSKLACGGLFRDDKVTAGGDKGARWKGKIDAVDTPAREVSEDPHLVEEFNPLSLLRGALRVVLNLVENHHGVR